MSLTFLEKKDLAKIYATSTLVPTIYRNSPSNCFIAIEIAEKQFGMDPMQIMQNMYPMEIKKKNAQSDFKFCITTSLAISFAVQSGFLFPGTTISYTEEGEGDNFSITASMLLKNQETISYTLSMATAKKSGWSQKTTSNGSYVPEQWKNFPELMLRYRAAIFLIRTHIPQVLLGCHTKEEIEDIKDIEPIEEKIAISKPKISEDLRITEKEDQLSKEKQIAHLELQSIIEEFNITEETIDKWCKKAQVFNISELDKETIDKIVAYYTKKNNENNEVNYDQ
jgi:hypothetical protein